jgi:DNA polymerase
LALGATGPKVVIALEEGQRLVKYYRDTHPGVLDLWRKATTIIQWLLNGTGDFMWGPLRVFGEHLVLPNGLSLHYSGLHASENGFAYKGRNTSVKLYGGKVVENGIQSLARIIVSDQMLAIGKRYRIATMTHDEIVAVVPEQEADEALAWMLDQMRVAPEWAVGLPLNAEGGYAQCYSK